MELLAWAVLIAGALCGVLRCIKGTYFFSALVSALCGCAVLLSGGVVHNLPIAAGLFVSIAADWFLAHQKGHPERFLYGVVGFFIAHCLFGAHALMRFAFNMPAVIVAAALLVCYIIYMARRVLHRVDKALRVPVVMYMLVSLGSLYAAMSMAAAGAEKALYIAGIASILFSDTMIAENEFVGVKAAGRLVLPTYYLCHVLIALSIMI